MRQKITKLVLPVAGLGKRLLPLTSKIPKNLVTVCGKPLLEYVLEEAEISGIKEVVLIVNPEHKKHFEEYLKKGRKIFNFRFYIREQLTPGGNGHAIAQAYDLLGKEPFIVRFCDDVILSRMPVTGALVKLFNKYKKPIVLLERVPKILVSRFGVVATRGKHMSISGKIGGRLFRIVKIVEKPAANRAPSNLTIVGGYVLTPKIIADLKSVAETLPVIANDALPLAVALQISLITGGQIYGWEFDGRRLDCGTLENLGKAEEVLNNINRTR